VATSDRSVLAGRRVLLGVTGGIAAYKACVLTRLLRLKGASVRVVMTGSAQRFVGPATFAALSDHRVYTDLWEEPGTVLHVRLAREADVAVVAPATANVIAKLARGFSDDLLCATLLEFPGPLVVAPAMHTGMWEHPATRTNVRMVEELYSSHGLRFDRGDLAGRRIVVTAGPTWEPIDPVRFVGNRSTGKMGFAVAEEAFRRGADVTLVVGPGTREPPEGPTVERVTTAEEMREAVMRAAGDADAVVMAAAVADFRPEATASGKLKKDQGPPEVRLVPTPDILAELGAWSDRRVLVGFAAETEGVEDAGRRKLRGKGLDLLVANEVGREGTGFGSDANRAAIVAADGQDEPMRNWTKRELAGAICDRLAKLLTH
jgi:phosphopantothenoylcysteine decarboxylase / phosphopantothenate---cysteine ligase